MEIYAEDLEAGGLMSAAARVISSWREGLTDLSEELKDLELALEDELPQEMRGGSKGALYEFGRDAAGRAWCVIGFSYPPKVGPFAAADSVMLRDALTGESKDVSMGEYRALMFIGTGNTPPKDWKDGDRVINFAGKTGRLDKSGRGSSTHWRVYWDELGHGPTPFYMEKRLDAPRPRLPKESD